MVNSEAELIVVNSGVELKEAMCRMEKFGIIGMIIQAERYSSERCFYEVGHGKKALFPG